MDNSAEKLLVLGTGNAAVTDCFNTCFVLSTPEGLLLTDCGGGNGILRQLKAFGLKAEDIHNIYISHEHCDHLTGIIWLMRMITQGMLSGKYEGNLEIWCQEILEDRIKAICCAMLPEKQTRFFGDRVLIHTVKDGDSAVILGRRFTFFDINSTKAPQFGYSADLDCGRLVFAGDEPVSPNGEKYARDADWLLCEAFSLESEADIFSPYKKHHSTAADAGQLAERLNVKNLLLWHTEESDLPRRKARYTAEAAEYYSGNILVPDDLEIIEL